MPYANPEDEKACRDRNREKRREQQRLAYALNPQKFLDRGKKRREARKDEDNKKQREKYRNLTPDQKKIRLANAKKWSHDNVEKARESKRVYAARKHSEVFDLLGRVCVRCGFSDMRALQIDHVNGGGCQERKSMHDRILYNHILSVGGVGYQILCANCNWIKRVENKEHTHRIE